jgi:O-antigen/teichoic acid export membrane protein
VTHDNAGNPTNSPSRSICRAVERPDAFNHHQMLKGKAIQSAIAKLVGQSATLILRLAYLAILARTLSPGDFGLVAMVTVVTGIFELFTTAGLSSATVQRTEITEHQRSQLFWINVLVGSLLSVLCTISAPFIADFYGNTRLFWITLAMAPAFLINAAGVQHSALLQREMRYVTLSAIDTLSQFASTFLGVALALSGYGYWALVWASLATPAANTACLWLVTGWLPRGPSRGNEIGPMLRFGGTITLNSLTVYVGYNLEKVLLGRFWGAESLGLYTRAVQLINLPAGNINSAVSSVFFSALSRLQDDPVRYRNFFLKGYALVMALAIPATMFFAMFAEGIVAAILGPNWTEAASVIRLVTPAVLVTTIINPLSWVLLSIGKQRRSLHVGLVLAPLVMVSYLVGINYGPSGVALSYSIMMVLWVVPHVAWCLHGTPISIRDLVSALAGPFLSSTLALICVYELQCHFGLEMPAALSLTLGGLSMATLYGWILLFPMGYRELYINVLTALRRPPGIGV